MFNPYSKELLCGAKKINMPKFGNDIWKMMNHENRGDFMYESPITNYISEIYDKQMVERENFILTTVSEKIGVDVNREELIKALKYDRHQYEKGYADAKAEYAPKWTRVEDGLPETDGEYLLFGKMVEDEDDNVFIGEYDVLAEEFGWWEQRFDKETLGVLGSELREYASVIAWMPIPKYEGVSE